MNLTIMSAIVFEDLSAAAGTEWTQDEIERCIDAAVAELSRFAPRELMAEFTVPAEIVDEAWTSSSAVAVALANKPIKYNSETIKQAAVEFTRNTDYTVDYINGTVTMLAAGAMVDATASTITYTVHRAIFDISSILNADLIAIEEVQAGVLTTPKEPSAYELWGDWLEIITSGNDTQEQIPAEHHVRIKYSALHTVPTSNTSGTFRRHHDEVVIRGAAGFAMRIKASDMQHQIVTDLASLRTAMARIDVYLSNGTRDASDALGEMDTELATALTTLLAIRGTSSEPFERAQAALDAISGAATDPFEEAISTALLMNNQIITDGDAAADLIDALITGAGSVDAELDIVVADITAIRVDTAAALANLESDTRNADEYLNLGDAFLNGVNEGGQNVPADYVAYANAKTAMAQTFVANASQEVAILNGRIASTQQRVNIVQLRMQEVRTRVELVSAMASEIASYNSLIQSKIAEANAETAMAVNLVNEANTQIQAAIAHGQEAAHWQNMAQITVSEVNSWTVAIAESRLNVDTFSLEADKRLGEFRNALRGTEASHQAAASRRQYS